MPRKTDFSAEKPYKIGSLTYEETRKHAADRESGVSLQWILHILSDCKKVDVTLHKKTILGALSKAVREKKLFFVKGCYQLPNQREMFAERQKKLERIRKERERLRQKEASDSNFHLSLKKSTIVESQATSREVIKNKKEKMKKMKKKKNEEMKKKKNEEMKKKKDEEMKKKKKEEMEKKRNEKMKKKRKQDHKRAAGKVAVAEQHSNFIKKDSHVKWHKKSKK